MRILLLRSAPAPIVASALRALRLDHREARITLVESGTTPPALAVDETVALGVARFARDAMIARFAGEKFDVVVVPETDPDGVGYDHIADAIGALKIPRSLAFRPGQGLLPFEGRRSKGTLGAAGIAIALAARALARILDGGRNRLFAPSERVGEADVYFLERSSIDTVLAENLPSGSGLLVDIGCGAMPHRALAESRGRRYLGVDLDRRTDRDRLVTGSALAIPLRSGCAGTAWSIETIEHLPDPGAFTREAARILAPGGLFLLVAPQVWGLHEEPHDYWRFTCHGLEHLAREAGLEVVRMIPRGGYRAAAIQRFIAHLNRSGVPRADPGGFLDWLSALNRLAMTRDADPNETIGWLMVARKP